jgi:sulfur relay (sulfurtransferase) complex TusBCD TusD component (DsrE family)
LNPNKHLARVLFIPTCAVAACDRRTHQRGVVSEAEERRGSARELAERHRDSRCLARVDVSIGGV